MTQPRKALICLADTPYYHIVSRCVRRSFLCGADPISGRDYEHRRQWIVDRIRLLSSLFAIDICAYAVMSNHYHLVLKICPEQIASLTNNDIMQRWCSLFKGPVLVQRYLAGDPLSAPERDTVSDIIAVWRTKLSCISWFMRCLNQPIARQANQEDHCTGHFWESRFKSQALKTEEALLSCMAYVDLNPIRAQMAETPEGSDYTSVQERIQPRFNKGAAITEEVPRGTIHSFEVAIKPLLHFEESVTHTGNTGIPCAYSAYLTLVDWTGRIIREDKRGAIPQHIRPILQRLNIESRRWLNNATQFEVNHRWQLNRKPPLTQTG